jgi:hypothetical protein
MSVRRTIFIKPQISIGHGANKGPDESPDNGDRDSLIWAPRKPAPTFNADAIAIPEPDSN